MSARPPIDHRRATAERNATAILDAAERLLAQGATLTMSALAAEAGVSRPTLYAHHDRIGDVVEAVIARAVDESLAAIDAAEPESGPAEAALERMAAASWDRIARYDAAARGAVEHMPAGALHRSHAPIGARLQALVERGRAEGVFRTDLPSDWLAAAYVALVHAADGHAREHGLPRDDVLAMLTASLRSLFAAR